MYLDEEGVVLGKRLIGQEIKSKINHVCSQSQRRMPQQALFASRPADGNSNSSSKVVYTTTFLLFSFSIIHIHIHIHIHILDLSLFLNPHKKFDIPLAPHQPRAASKHKVSSYYLLYLPQPKSPSKPKSQLPHSDPSTPLLTST